MKSWITVFICNMPSEPGFEDDPMTSFFIQEMRREEQDCIRSSPHNKRTGMDDVDDECYGGPERGLAR